MRPAHPAYVPDPEPHRTRPDRMPATGLVDWEPFAFAPTPHEDSL